MATENEKLKTGLSQKHFQPEEHTPQETSESIASYHIHPRTMQNLPILAQGLTLAGFVQTFPQALVYGPLKMCGINLPNLFMEQTVTHIHTLLKFSNQPQDLTGFLLWATGEAMWLETGLTRQLFEAPLVLADTITDTWMKHTWIVTRQAKIHLTIDIPDFQLK